ncbi:hypothetical protein [Acetobacter sacchari]|uniref:hypothetical protein n=1 Tax=Acetobacter sacchari TaxID=2661687 RepID=UPI0038D0087D
MFSLDWYDFADRLEIEAVIEPAYPFGGIKRPAEAALTDHLDLEQAADSLGQGLVAAVTDASGRGAIPTSAKRLAYRMGHIGSRNPNGGRD